MPGAQQIADPSVAAIISANGLNGNFTNKAIIPGYFTMTVLSASRVTVFVTVPCPLTGTILTS